MSDEKWMPWAELLTEEEHDLVMALREHEDSARNAKLLTELLDDVAIAERKHPLFATGPYEGFGRIGEEYGEACQSLNHAEPEDRLLSEVRDLGVVVYRFRRGDWAKEGS